MLTQKYLKLHTRAKCILEMVESCDRRIADCRHTLKSSYGANWFTSTRSHYERLIKKYHAIKQRLIEYYADVMKRLIEPAMSNAKFIGNIVINEFGKAEVI